jgi:hypothetical protein
LKKKLQDAIRYQEQNEKDLKMKELKYQRTKDDIDFARKDIKKAIFNNKKQRALQQQITNMPDPIKFVDQKNISLDLKNSSKNWERKIEIAEVAAKKAKVIIRSAGEHVEDIEKPTFDFEN